jgi:hypothetical protein
VVKRAFVMAVFVVVAAIPILFIKLEDVGNPIVIMVTNVVLPGAFISYFFVGGWYDKII